NKNIKFVIITGGGRVAREYINGLKKEGLNQKMQSLIGIAVTRLNARFMSNFFKNHASSTIPNSLKEIRNLLSKNNIVFAGGLRYQEDNTSDGTATQITSYLKCEFVNMTNVKGLYNKDPEKHRDAKFIKEISFDDFYKMISKIKYEAGQHFVLDQHAAKIIKENKIKTTILGKDLKNFENYLKNKEFVGTIIS
ncbi:MAG: UMP kinase, partial [Candidatus Woesearchaeota archaeon]|nr:UMP kinase [Candidatus Woesearchaeota archaeon]